MTLADAVAALEYENEKLRKDMDGWKQLAEKLRVELDEALAIIEGSDPAGEMGEPTLRDAAELIAAKNAEIANLLRSEKALKIELAKWRETFE